MLTHAKPRALLSIMTLGKFFKMLPRLIFIVVLISKNPFFALLWKADISRTPIKMQRGDGDQSCRGKLVRPQGLKKLIQISGHVSLFMLLYLCL